MIEKYTLPTNITNGLGWASTGTVNLGSTKAYLSDNVPMPENDGLIYCWDDRADLLGGSFVRVIGFVGGREIIINASAKDINDKILLTIMDEEIVAVEIGMALLLPADAILTVTNGSYVGQFIMTGDRFAKSYIASVSDLNKFAFLEGEGMILDNVKFTSYGTAGVRLTKPVSAETHIQNVDFDDTVIDGLVIESTWEGSMDAINNFFGSVLEISNLNSVATLDIRNNIITALILGSGSTDFTNMIRNNFIETLTKSGSEILPEKAVKDGWYTLVNLEEMEIYRGNIVSPDPIPESYGYLKGYGKIALGTNGGLPYLDSLDELDYERRSDKDFIISWTKKQPSVANSYRVRMTRDQDFISTFVPHYADVGNSYRTRLYDQMTLSGYPSDNDGDGDGVADNKLNFSSNNIWFIVVQAQMLLGERLLSHLSPPSPVSALPVRELGEIPDFSRGLQFPVHLENGEFKSVQKTDNVRSSIYQTVMTNVGERVIHSRGGGLRPLIFNGVIDPDLMKIAQEHLRTEIQVLDPRVRVTGVNFTAQEENNGGKLIVVDIYYTDLEAGKQEFQSIGLPYGTN